MSLRLRYSERCNPALSSESDHINLNSWRKQKDMCTVSVIFTPATRSPPATGEQRMILCASRSCSEEGSLLFLFPLHQYKKEHLILVPTTNTDTLLFLWVSFTHSSTYPTQASPRTKFSWMSPACMPHPLSFCIYPAHALFYPSLWSSKLPMLRSWKHLYIYSISTPAASAMHLSSAGLDDLYSQSGPMQP